MLAAHGWMLDNVAMRCNGCGDRISRVNPGVSGRALVLCSDCISEFSDIRDGRTPEPRTTTLHWAEAMAELCVLDGFSDTQLRFELGVVQDLAAPSIAFIEAAQRKLVGDPSWRHVELPGLHKHRDRVVLPDGTQVRASSLRSGDGANRGERDDVPERGVYLDRAWQPTWPHMMIDWPDFGLPSDRAVFLDVVNDVLCRARGGAIVEIGCVGGHGRTGTFLAVLAIQAGEPSRSAVAWVRSHYCHEAIETDEQVAFIESF